MSGSQYIAEKLLTVIIKVNNYDIWKSICIISYLHVDPPVGIVIVPPFKHYCTAFVGELTVLLKGATISMPTGRHVDNPS